MLKNYYSIYKYGNWLVQHHVPVLPAVLKLVSRIFFPACDIPFTAKIGKNAYFPHRAIGVVIHENAVIGENSSECRYWRKRTEWCSYYWK